MSVPVVCDEALISEVEELVRLGVPPLPAVLAQGVSEDMFAEWMGRAARPSEDGSDEMFVELRRRVLRAEARCEAVLVGRVRAAAANNWQAAAWLAERRFPERYVRKSVADRRDAAAPEPTAADPFSDLDDSIDNVLPMRRP